MGPIPSIAPSSSGERGRETNAARSAALYASGTAQDSDVLTAQQAALAAAQAETVNLVPPLQDTDVTVVVTTTQATGRVRYQFRPIVPWPGLPAVIDMDFSVTMPLTP